MSCGSLFPSYLTWWMTLLSKFSSVQFSRSVVSDSATPWIAAGQASLSITNSRSLPKPMPIESVIPSSHLILCRPLLLLPPIPPSIRIFSNESTLRLRWPKSFSISPSNEVVQDQSSWVSPSTPPFLTKSCPFQPRNVSKIPGASDGKESACNVGDPGSIPWSGRLPGERNGSPLQCSCLTWKTPWTESLVGSQRVRHNWSTSTTH